jgi:hypothetical protein
MVRALDTFASEIGTMLCREARVFGATLQVPVTDVVTPMVPVLVAHADQQVMPKDASDGEQT